VNPTNRASKKAGMAHVRLRAGLGMAIVYIGEGSFAAADELRQRLGVGGPSRFRDPLRMDPITPAWQVTTFPLPLETALAQAAALLRS
jgi:hypothetical protein